MVSNHRRLSLTDRYQLGQNQPPVESMLVSPVGVEVLHQLGVDVLFIRSLEEFLFVFTLVDEEGLGKLRAS
jgi:hypothetical protein